MISTVIYDLDDTMVNSEPLHARSWAALLKEHGYSREDIPEELRASFMGMRVIDVAGEIVDYLGLKASKDDVYKRRIELFLEIVKDELEPMPGLVESLERLKSAGIRLAVASSGAKKYVNLVLEKFEVAQYFEAVTTGDDVTIGKPHPESYLVTAKKLGVSPSECVVLEDATKGIQSAKAAGCVCIAIKNPNIPPQDVSQADLVLDSLEQVDADLLKRF